MNPLRYLLIAVVLTLGSPAAPAIETPDAELAPGDPDGSLRTPDDDCVPPSDEPDHHD